MPVSASSGQLTREGSLGTINVESRQAAPLGGGNIRLAEGLAQALGGFVVWLDGAGYASFDPYDIWGTPYGLFARRVYYQRAWLGGALVAPVVLMELLAPGWRRLLVKKARYATADAQLILAFLNLHRIGLPCSRSSVSEVAPHHAVSPGGGEGDTGAGAREEARGVGDRKGNWLSRARVLAEELLAQSVPGYSGHCWGYPFDWRHNQGLWRKNTPLITCTPYAFEAFLGLHEVTGEARYLDAAESIARFVAEDLHDTPTGPDAAAASYSPQDRSAVVNASAYRAMVLFEAAGRWGRQNYREKARRNLNFILQSQRPDGSWLYAMDNPAEAFVDHFHTCFVLKNLVKINRGLESEAVTEAIRRGYAYYREALFDAEGNPRPFAVRPRLQLVRLELYDVAEAITLGVLLKDGIPEGFRMAQELAKRVIGEWQLGDGHFVTRVYRGGLRHTLPFLRWPQAQLFYALTSLLRLLSGQGPGLF